mgnify:FL=1
MLITFVLFITIADIILRKYFNIKCKNHLIIFAFNRIQFLIMQHSVWHTDMRYNNFVIHFHSPKVIFLFCFFKSNRLIRITVPSTVLLYLIQIIFKSPLRKDFSKGLISWNLYCNHFFFNSRIFFSICCITP